MNPYLIAIVLGVPILVLAVIYGRKRGVGLREQGLITDRPSQFVEREYIYASPVFDFDQLLDAIKRIDFDTVGASVGWKADRARRLVQFSSTAYEYQAVLAAIEDKDGEHRYRFSFPRWTSHRNLPKNAESMNRLMTALEKAMLGLDPYVTVRSELVETKSRSKLL